ncbi:hypothetical protein [Marasmitruncus massiliensis]|uniref:hypothetical protein n=1 Tax=Marasmitruncus massiliensis TaxID=1944642 RepID=UPI000C7A20BD|nr:hypothetical protein [Marasmitruncus massiliensis]
MPDYKEMYFKMFRASEKALNIIIHAQRECEELYSANPSPEMKVVSFLAENNESTDKNKF